MKSSTTGRPNELEPAMLDWSRRIGKHGTTVNEAAAAILSTAEGRRTPRALALACNRLVEKGILTRKIEHSSLTNGQVIRRFRYWHVESAP